jgi:ParB family chromosome partitioning protein
VLSAGHARAILALDDPAGQERLAQRVVAEGLSVRAVEEIVTMGEVGKPVARQRSRREAPQQAFELADRLSDHLETRVRVEVGRSRGRITVEFATLDDLARIARAMNLPGDVGT